MCRIKSVNLFKINKNQLLSAVSRQKTEYRKFQIKISQVKKVKYLSESLP